ncbi:putative patatin-like serine hydrolase [Schizothecium vesticola]|uniref:Patatin-like serine hydrolase n=1 Tax=Schizothecium vesticola TaxID=314040 RepID=A0AA40EV15_9PEZI|nr:putative patatin-like serine hydrolase [Schizothecium vesticola]
MESLRRILVSVLGTVWYIVFFWFYKLRDWYRSRSEVDIWLDALRRAPTYERWENAALHLDDLIGLNFWRNTPTSNVYDYRLIAERTALIATARARGDINGLIDLLRSGLVRNLANITANKLYNRAFAGTKTAIENYITQVAEAIEDIASLPTSTTEATAMAAARAGDLNYADVPLPVMSTQMKLDFSHDTRQAFGRTSLVLQGGTIFGLCHLGVVKALFLRGLLPRIITGSETGALIAALVAIHTEEELPDILTGNGIDLSAFAGKAIEPPIDNPGFLGPFTGSWTAMVRRVRRFRREGYFLDMKVLEECVRANVGDLTFEEAYQRSKRILNIILPTTQAGDRPFLLNYITTPNVLVWTAAVASNGSHSTLYGSRGTGILCKDAHGHICPWESALPSSSLTTTTPPPPRRRPFSDRNSPLHRAAALFNVNHFIISQARPYLLPFLQSDMHGPSATTDGSATLALALRTLASELRHRIAQLDALGLLPARIRRFLVDERVPGPSVTLVPDVTARDFVRLLEVPTPRGLEHWIGKGERSVWPAVAALRVRCVVEMELERTYQAARRVKPGREGVVGRAGRAEDAGPGPRQRARSTGGEGGSGS